MFLKLCLSSPENRFNFINQKFAKKWKMTFSKVQNICFVLQADLKSFSRMLSMSNCGFKWYWRLFFDFSEKDVHHSKSCKITEEFYFQWFKTFVSELKVALNYLLKSFLWPIFYLNDLKALSSLTFNSVTKKLT